jgi:nitroreductase
LRDEKKELAESAGQIDADTLALYMQKRRSIRHFTKQSVSKDVIRQILEVARYAPSGGNSQSVKWLVIHDRSEVKRIASLTVDWMRTIQGTPHPLANYVPGIIKAWDMGMDPICCNAPHLLFAHLPHNDFYDDRTDAIIALSYLDIAAPAFGVGTCWAGFIRMAVDSYQPLKDALALPDKRKVGYAMFFGYPAYPVAAIPRRNALDIVWR